jgi:carbamoyl-phosphate synthase large subunit
MFIAQEYIDADEEEYTCGSVTLDGECRAVIVMRRVLRDGDTYKCWVVNDATIEAEVRKAVTAIRPFGPCNVQLRVKDGIPYVFELNARSSGTTAARALSGFNEPVMVADYLCHGFTPRYEIVEQTVLRYWNELAVDNASIEALTADGRLTRPGAPRL